MFSNLCEIIYNNHWNIRVHIVYSVNVDGCYHRIVEKLVFIIFEFNRHDLKMLQINGYFEAAKFRSIFERIIHVSLNL